MQDSNCSNSSAILVARKLLQSCTKPSICNSIDGCIEWMYGCMDGWMAIHYIKDTSFSSFLVHDSVSTFLTSDRITSFDLILVVAFCKIRTWTWTSITTKNDTDWYQHTTVETLYSTIYYSKYFIELNFDKSTQYVALWTHKRHPIPRPFGRAMECLLWVFQQKLTVL